jgi:hypothetical protein
MSLHRRCAAATVAPAGTGGFRPMRSLAVLLLAGAAGLPAGAQAVTPALRDGLAVLAADALVESAARYCDAQAPAEAARLRSVQASWRERQAVRKVRDQVLAVDPRLQRLQAEPTQVVHERMAAERSPAEACGQVLALLSSPPMDLRRQYPAAYAAGAAAATKAAERPAPANGAAPARPPARSPRPPS